MNYIVPIIIALITGVPGIYALWVQSRKDKIDIGASLIEDALELKNEMKKDKIDIQNKFEASVLMYENLLKKQKEDIDKQLLIFENILSKAQAEMVLLKTAISRLKKRVTFLRKGVDILIEQIEMLGETPAWRPNEADEVEEELKN